MPLSDYNNQHILAPNFINQPILSRDAFVDPIIQARLDADIKATKDILFLPNCVDTFYNTGLLLIGTLESGAKASVLLKNVPHFFEVFPYKLINHTEIYPATATTRIDHPDFKEFMQRVAFIKENYEALKVEAIRSKILNVGQNYHCGVRLYFSTNKNRAEALKKCWAIHEFFVASNYTNQINSIFAIFNKYSGFWMTLRNYMPLGTKYSPPTKAKYNFQLNFLDYLVVDESRQDVYTNPGHNLKFTLDIETCEVKDEDKDEKSTGIINRSNEIFNICISVSDTALPGKELLSIGLFRPSSENYIKLQNDKFNIMCKTQCEIIMCLGHIFARLQPDFLITYNGNGFDIPIILLQARECGVFDHFYCLTSILSTDNIENQRNYSAKYKCFYNSGGYTNWSKISTTPTVSGIPTGCKEIKGAMPLKEFKLEADKKELYHYWSPPGCVNIDMYMIAKKAYPKAKSLKLNDVLKLKKINTQKDDMTYEELWRIWRASQNIMNDASLLDDLTRIDKYCRQDCHCTDLLECGFMLIIQKRAMCKYTCLPFSVVTMQADGVKATTGITRLCHKEQYTLINQFINKSLLPADHAHLRYHRVPQKSENQGAIVDIYKRGKVHIDHAKYGTIIMPVDAVDAASLYPNSIIANNLSPECFVFNNPNNDQDYAEHYLPDLPQNIIDEFGIIDNKVWIKKHHNDRNKYGIIPKFLVELFDDRKKVKNKIAQIQAVQDELTDDFKSRNPKSTFAQQSGLTGLELDSAYDKYFNTNIDLRYHEQESLKKTYDAEQLTIKILMNTVYGCAKYEKNAIYCYLVAHITTKFGREIITKANEIVRELGGTVCYNDTDSVYFYHAVDSFEDILAQGVTGQDLKRKMVNRSMKLSFGRQRLFQWYCDKYFKLIGEKPRFMNVRTEYERMLKLTTSYPFHQKLVNLQPEGFNDILNRRLAEYTGGDRIEFVREETLCPVVFATKKKYFGHKHEWSFEEELTENHLLVKGISYVTRNASIFLKEFNKNIMLEILASPFIDVESIIFDKMKRMYATAYSPDKYAKYFTYKPGVKNEAMNMFVDRMKLLHAKNPELYRIPNPLEVIGLVLTRATSFCNLNGSNKTVKKGALYEYIDVVKAENKAIDRDSYLRSLYPTCSQLLTYKEYPEFYDEKLSVKEYKKLIQDKYVKPYFERIINSQPENIKLEIRVSLTKQLLKQEHNRIICYFINKYTLVSDVLIMLAAYSGTKSPFNYLRDKIDKRAIKPCKTIMSDMHFNLLSKQSLVIPSLADLKTMECALSEYELFVNAIYARMESKICDKLIRAHDSNMRADYMEIDLFNETELEILAELRHIIATYVFTYQYHVMYQKNADVKL